MTEADKIRSMSDDELAEWLSDIADCWWCPAQHTCKGIPECTKTIEKWLKQEHVENGEGNGDSQGCS